MGKSMVLKDEKNRPCGYLRVLDDAIVCRAKTGGGASQIVLFFEDGTQQVLEITGEAEQQLPYFSKRLTGCCVIGSGAVLASDDAARAAYVVGLMRNTEKSEPHKVQPVHTQESAPKRETVLQTSTEQEEKKEREGSDDKDERGGLMPQRRWPPPPCLEGACYHLGRWQEKEKQPTSK